MRKQNVVAIFDIGKTNKKLFLFDHNYKIVFERSTRLLEILDEDGEPCENVESLKLFVLDSISEILRLPQFEIKAINFSGYGASFVYLNKELRNCAPLYNYLKKYPENLKKQFYETYDGEEEFSILTASPVLGSLNAGMQLYRIKYEKPGLFSEIKYALHLPQYLSFLISGQVYSDITSIGCHTNLWNFHKNEYHNWVQKEGMIEKLPPILSCNTVVPATLWSNTYVVGIGLHDSSAALIPYLVNFQDPFILLSTGTWCISINPFNLSPLTKEELEKDCLCYMTYQGKSVKASRLFAGNEYERQIKRISDHFNQNIARYHQMNLNPEIIYKLQKGKSSNKLKPDENNLKASLFADRDLNDFITDEEAYHQLMLDIVSQQYISTLLVLKGTGVKRIFVDGGFSKNEIFMNLLAAFFHDIQIFAASMAQATAVGAALAIHNSWNYSTLPKDFIDLNYFSAKFMLN